MRAALDANLTEGRQIKQFAIDSANRTGRSNDKGLTLMAVQSELQATAGCSNMARYCVR